MAAKVVYDPLEALTVSITKGSIMSSDHTKRVKNNALAVHRRLGMHLAKHALIPPWCRRARGARLIHPRRNVLHVVFESSIVLMNLLTTKKMCWASGGGALDAK